MAPGRVGRLFSLASLLIVAALIASPAFAVERVTDGSFEDPGLPAWTKNADGFMGFTEDEDFQCKSGDSQCSDSFSPQSGTAWAQLGYALGPGGIGQCPCLILQSSSLSQMVTIPQGATTMSFYVAFDPGDGDSTFNARIDGTSVFSATQLDPPGVYQRVDPDVSAFAKGGTHLLSFEHAATGQTLGTQRTDGWAIDSVSLDSEPDCDNDGLGDQTQDTNLSSCAPGTIPPPAPGPGGTTVTCKGLAATIVGTGGNDVRTGSQGKDVIAGLGGNDAFSGIAGNDVICGGAGKDTLKGGKGKDSLLGQKGKDALKGGGGKDLCKGGKGNDSASKCEVEKSI
jgi:Ca2+-binding RTX toxin-like protein